jgi:lipocalin
MEARMCFQFKHGLADMSISYRTRSEGYITFTNICQKLRVEKFHLYYNIATIGSQSNDKDQSIYYKI